jgi:hypothetical protein
VYVASDHPEPHAITRSGQLVDGPRADDIFLDADLVQ